MAGRSEELRVTTPPEMRVAIVGAGSQIGVALMPKLRARGCTYFRIGRGSAATEGEITHVFDPESRVFSPPLSEVDAVISLAPLPTIPAVLEIAHTLSARRVIAFGSTGRFSKAGSSSPLEQEFVRQQEEAEAQLIEGCRALNMGWTLFRPSMIYGADVDLNVTFIRSMVQRFGWFPLPWGAHGLRQPVHVGDLAEACLAALTKDATVNRAYNLGGGQMLSFPELVRCIFRTEGRKPRLLPVPRWAYFLLIGVARYFRGTAFVRREMVERMYVDLTVDNTAAAEDFGYSPRPFTLASRIGAGDR